MPSLQEELINSFGGGYNNKAEEMLNSSFLNNRQSWVNNVVNDYMRHNIDPNESIRKIAAENNLNDEQIQRVIEESNVNIYLKKYAETKGQSVRRVNFPLADPMKVKQTIPVEEEKAASTNETSTLEKAASVMEFNTKEDTQTNFLTSTTQYEPSLWEPGTPEKVATILVKKKLTNKLAQAKVAKAQELRELLQKVAFIGDSLIYTERAGQSGQKLLNKIAQDVDFYGYPQIPLLKYVEEKVASMQEKRKLPSNFSISLSPSEKTTNKYSLGKHSLNKEASDDIVIKVDKLPNGTDYEKLIQVAAEIKEQLKKNPPKDITKPIEIEGV